MSTLIRCERPNCIVSSNTRYCSSKCRLEHARGKIKVQYVPPPQPAWDEFHWDHPAYVRPYLAHLQSRGLSPNSALVRAQAEKLGLTPANGLYELRPRKIWYQN